MLAHVFALTTHLRSRRLTLLSASAAVLLMLACQSPPPPASPSKTPLLPPSSRPTSPPTAGQAPTTPREFRAVWVSTVANIDWPSRRDLSSEKQKAEILTVLDQAAEMKLNAIILQVRPAADAIYPSAIEPWSEFLTGEQGRAPRPYYDPLQFWIEQAHQRGLELHAWFNPYRARSAGAKGSVAKNHISRSVPSVVRQYGELQWMDPSEPQAMEQTLRVISDVVHRYDVDGIHIDDYFYPYPIKNSSGAEVDFPDDANWNRYLQNAGTLSRADWRRTHVNNLVEALNQVVHREKTWVKFGISPFGIGRLDRMPPGITGFSQYDKLYADVELWLGQGWLDYLAPQLYWPINQTPQAFKVLYDYWQAQNLQQRHIWPGLYTSRIDQSERSWSANEILNQVEVLRERSGDGHIHFSMISLLQNRKDIRQRLATEKYATVALVPASPWLESTNLAAPQLHLSADQQSLRVNLVDPENTRWLAVWRRSDEQWLLSVQSAQQLQVDITLPNKARTKEISITAISRSGQESLASSLTLTH